MLLVGGIDTLDDVKTYWTMFLHDVNLIVFVVDANDTDKLPIVLSSFKVLMDEPQLYDVPILVVANKQVIIIFHNFVLYITSHYNEDIK